MLFNKFNALMFKAAGTMLPAVAMVAGVVAVGYAAYKLVKVAKDDDRDLTFQKKMIMTGGMKEKFKAIWEIIHPYEDAITSMMDAVSLLNIPGIIYGGSNCHVVTKYKDLHRAAYRMNRSAYDFHAELDDREHELRGLIKRTTGGEGEGVFSEALSEVKMLNRLYDNYVREPHNMLHDALHNLFGTKSKKKGGKR